MSAQHTPGPPGPLDATEDEVDRALKAIEKLTRRFGELERLPGGREALTYEQRVEYDVIGSALSRIQIRSSAAIAKAAGSAA